MQNEIDFGSSKVQNKFSDMKILFRKLVQDSFNCVKKNRNNLIEFGILLLI